MTTEEALRERVGREVRRVWVAWAREQPDPKPSWLVPWEALGEADREVDRRIGLRLYALGVADGIVALGRVQAGEVAR